MRIVALLLVLASATCGVWAERSLPLRLTLKSSEALKSVSPLMYARYLKPDGLEMVKLNAHSPDNGATWTSWKANPDFSAGLPHGYRRGALPLFVDETNGRVIQLLNCLDTPGLDPKIVEPPIALETYYLRYRVSVDGGKTYLFDEPIIQRGHTQENPFDGVYYGKNGIFMGDVGSQMIRTRAGRIIIPAQACKLGSDGKLFNPGGGWTYTNVIMIIGTWGKDNRLDWQIGEPIEGDPARSTRGMIEPTVIEVPDGRLLCVMRGSNGGTKDKEYKLPGYRWFSISEDGGFHWTKPEPWTYDHGQAFFSPSSMSQLLKTRSGRVLWIGNINSENSAGNERRYPLVIGEVDPDTLQLIKRTVLTVDTKRPEEENVYLSHWWAYEDRPTRDIVIAGARHGKGYKTQEPWLWRVGVAER